MASKQDIEISLQNELLEAYQKMAGAAFDMLLEGMAELSAFYDNEYDWEELLAVALHDLRHYTQNGHFKRRRHFPTNPSTKP